MNVALEPLFSSRRYEPTIHINCGFDIDTIISEEISYLCYSDT